VSVTIAIAGDEAGDESRNLAAEFGQYDSWRGQVEVIERPGTGGALTEGLWVAVAPGAVTALLTVLVTWLRYRTSDLDVTVKRTGEEVTLTISGRRIRDLPGTELGHEIARLARHLDDAPQPARRP
jgi:hypothetical protein